MNGSWVRKVEGKVVVVFIHGILSSGKTAWGEHKGSTWIELLHDEVEPRDVSIYSYEYATSFSSNTYSIGDIVDDLKERMRLDNIHLYPDIVFVCHSMGGIVVRKLIVERAAEFIERGTRIGLFLVASPSLGSKYANWLSSVIKAAGHSQANKLRFSQDNDWLNDLDKEFQNLKESGRLKLLGKELIEDKFIALRRYGVFRQVVEPFSGSRYFGERYKVPGSDHFSIAKPQSNEAIQHRMLCQFISDLKVFQSDNDIGQLESPPVITLTSIESTCDHSLGLIAKGQRPPFILHAWNQSHGRGKTGRIWQGGAGILTATWNYELSKERSSPEIIGVLSIVTSLAVRDAICSFSNDADDVEVKWPNDVLIGGKKVAGILIEVSSLNTNKVVSIGVGVNVCRSPVLTDRSQFSLPPGSIFKDYDDDNSREARVENVLNAITKSLAARLKRLFTDGGIAGQRTEFERHDFLNGEMLLILSPQDKELARGKNIGINSYGQLIVEYGYGNRKEYHSGEVASVRGVSGPDINMPEPSPKSEILASENGGKYYIFKSPLVGTFYAASSFGQPPCVNVGDEVKAGQVLCVIEAMKMVNKIEADLDGTIAEVYLKNGDPVGYGEPLFRIIPTI